MTTPRKSDSAFLALYDADSLGLHNASRTHLPEHGPVLCAYDLLAAGRIDWERYLEMVSR